MKIEILVHIGAPATVHDDRRYRAIAQHVANFEAVTLTRITDNDNEDEKTAVNPRYPNSATREVPRAADLVIHASPVTEDTPALLDLRLRQQRELSRISRKRKRDHDEQVPQSSCVQDSFRTHEDRQARTPGSLGTDQPVMELCKIIDSYPFAGNPLTLSCSQWADQSAVRPHTAPEATPARLLVPFTGRILRHRSLSESFSSNHGTGIVLDSQPLLPASAHESSPLNTPSISLEACTSHGSTSMFVINRVDGSFAPDTTKSSCCAEITLPESQSDFSIITILRTIRSLEWKVDSQLPPTSRSCYTTSLTARLEQYDFGTPVKENFLPLKVLRDVKFLERGYWKLPVVVANRKNAESRRRLQLITDPKQGKITRKYQQNSWTADEFFTFYSKMCSNIRANHLGHVSLYLEELTDELFYTNSETIRLTLRLYCWGESVGHLYVVMRLLSDDRIKHVPAEWIGSDGAMVVAMSGEVVAGQSRHLKFGYKEGVGAS